MLTRATVTPHTLLLLESVGQVSQLGGGDTGHLVNVTPGTRHHHPVQVIHQLGAVRVQGDVGRHPRSHGQGGLGE